MSKSGFYKKLKGQLLSVIGKEPIEEQPQASSLPEMQESRFERRSDMVRYYRKVQDPDRPTVWSDWQPISQDVYEKEYLDPSFLGTRKYKMRN